MIIERFVYKYRDELNRVVISPSKPDVTEYTTKLRLYTSDTENCVLTDGTLFAYSIDVEENEKDNWQEVLKADLKTEVHSIPQLIEMDKELMEMDNLLMSAIDETFITQEQNLDMILMAIDELYNLFMGGEE